MTTTTVTSDPYQILGLEPGAPTDDVRRAYRRLAKKHHPDLWASAPEMVQRHVARKMAAFSEAVKQIDHLTGVIDASRMERQRKEAERRAMFERWERAEHRARSLEDRFAAS